MAGDVGAIFAKLGISVDEFESGLKRATALAASQSGLMSAEMKRNNREAAESARLVSESLDLHISRPLSRVIAQLPGLGTALSALGGIGGAAGLFALGSFLVERLGPGIESIAQKYGLIAESAEEAGNRIKESDEKLIATLRRKVDLQEAYNRLVMGLKGADLEAGNITAMRAETEELQKQLALRTQELAQKIVNPDPGLFGNSKQWMSLLSAIPGLGKLAPGLDVDAIKKAQQALAPLVARIQEVTDAITKAGWQEYRDQVDEAAKSMEKNAAAHQKFINDILHALDLDRVQQFAAALAAVQQQVAQMKGPGLPALGGGTATPTLGSGGVAGARLSAFQGDQAAQMKLAADAYTSTLGPVGQYNIKVAELSLLLQKGMIDQQAFSSAVAAAADELEKASKKADKYLTSMSEGAREFFRQFDVEAGQRGKFVFDELNRGLQGVEEGIAQLAVTGRANWSRLLTGMEEDLVKFAENQALKMLLGMLNNSDFFGGLGGGGLFGSGGLFGGGRAGGGDVAPGMTYLVGEQGPELLHVGNSGSITPNGAGGNVTHNHYYDMRGADAAAVERLQRALPEVENRAAFRGYQMSLESQKRSTR